MLINILYFSWVEEAIGRPAEILELSADHVTVGGVLAALIERGPEYREALSDRSRLRFALDQQFVGEDAPVPDGAELGIFPPVTGG